MKKWEKENVVDEDLEIDNILLGQQCTCGGTLRVIKQRRVKDGKVIEEEDDVDIAICNNCGKESVLE